MSMRGGIYEGRAVIANMLRDGRIKVIPNEEASKIEWRLCARQAHIPGCAEADCSNCGCQVFYDTRTPVGENQKLVCILCAVQIAHDRE